MTSRIFFRALSYLGYFRYAWFIRSLEAPIEPVQAKADAELRHLAADDLDAYTELWRAAEQTMDLVPPNKFLAWLAEGRTCHAACISGRIVSITWTSVGSARLERLNREFFLDADEVYLHASYTLPDFRGLRIHQANGRHILEEYKARKFRWALSLIAPENRPSVRSRTHSGFRRADTTWTWKIGPWAWHGPSGNRIPQRI